MGVLDPMMSADAVLAAEHPVLGLARLHHRTPRGESLAFADKPFLVELYAEAWKQPSVVFQKCVGVGVSEMLLLSVLYQAGWEARICAYVLPTETLRDRFVQLRVNPQLVAVPAYRQRLMGGGNAEARGAASVSRRQFGRGSLMFLGANAPGSFVEFSADTLILDEYDLCDPVNIAKAGDRLRASKDGRIVRISNPSFPRVGVSRLFDDSDGRRWHHRCGRCGERQPIDWEANVVERGDDGQWRLRDRERAAGIRVRGRVVSIPGSQQPVRPVCRRCAMPFEREALTGQWVPTRPDNHQRGYHISRMDVLSDRLELLFGEFMQSQADPSEMAAFWAGTLGIAWSAGGGAITVQDIDRISTAEPLDHAGSPEDYAKEVVTAGIDVGTVCHITISVMRRSAPGEVPEETRRIGRWVGTARTEDDVKQILLRYSVDTFVIDAAPEGRFSQSLRDWGTSHGIVGWLCQFHPTPRTGTEKYGMRLDWASQTVTVDRTQTFDEATDQIRTGRRRLPCDIQTVDGYTDQMGIPKRVLDDAKQRVIWTKGVDHYRLSDLYDAVAADLVQQGGVYHG